MPIIINNKADGKKGKANENIVRSSTNIPGAEVTVVSELNTYDILKAKNLVLLESSVKEIESLLS